MIGQNLVEYIQTELAAKGITEQDYSNKGMHNVRINHASLESKFTRTLTRAGIELEYGYVITHDKLPHIVHTNQCPLEPNPKEWYRHMAFDVTDVLKSFEGDRTYYVSLVDEPTGVDLFKIEVNNNSITHKVLDPNENIFYDEFKDVMVGQPAHKVVDRIIEVFLNPNS